MEYVTIDLPSRLIPYSNVSEVQIRPLIGADEKFIASMNVKNFEKQLCDLLKSGVLKGIDPAELTIGDRMYIVLWLSHNSFRETYLTTGECDTCWNQKDIEVPLRELSVVYLREDFKEPMTIEMSDKSKVSIRLLRVKDQIKYMSYVLSKNGDEDPLYKLALTMVDDRDMRQRLDYLNSLPLNPDLNNLKKLHLESAHGLNMTYKYKCDKEDCGGHGYAVVPFQLGLLSPAVYDTTGYL